MVCGWFVVGCFVVGSWLDHGWFSFISGDLVTIAAALQVPFHENTTANKTRVNMFLLHPPFNSRMFVKIKK